MHLWNTTERVPQVHGNPHRKRGHVECAGVRVAAGHPIEMLITVGEAFQGMAGHDVVLVGYDATNASNPLIYVNDPFPYVQVSHPDEIVAIPGLCFGALQYSVPYANAVEGLQWSDSVFTTAN